MGTQPQSRLAIAGVLLTFQALLFVSQYLVSLQYHRKRKFLPGPAVLQSLIFPIFVAVLGIILIAVMFHGNDTNTMFNGNDSNKTCKAEIDDDIAGPGIRAAAWAQLGVLLFLALVGIFHTKTTGIKEFGASLTITHLSLVIALLFELQDLKATDAILGSMILDSQNSALSIPLVTKATLAARWQVWTIVPCQAFGLAVLGVLVHKFHQNHFKLEASCKCVSVVWWGRLQVGTEKHCTSGSEQTVFWLYYACRVLSVAQIGYQALVDTGAFHKAERKDNLVKSKMFHPLSDSHSGLKEFLQKLLRISGNTWRFTEYPTTLSLTFLVSGVFAVASMSAAEAAMKRSFGHQTDKFTPGQIISVVAAIIGIIIGVWRFIRLFLKSEQPCTRHEGKWRRWFLTSSLTSS
ncbi:hypothetical protein CGCS363_v008970 [Colletotrichum siamense]|uniref:uncharacterized protein n=1 Tax=Colletotrichum siamense TaxID=690259 RepID=UPI0018723FB3|nr:uncharacterized protein CGCS363_v008970 [Colletotrichum siamense]KAF5498026.1 hypothetical protein CGCS363_v008970 [Colletotrichum siamense]